MIAPLTTLDYIAVGFFWVSWWLVGRIIESSQTRHPSTTALMRSYRMDWLRHVITRDPRVFDAMITVSMRDGTAFFASACMIAIGGGLALVGNTEHLTLIAEDLSLDAIPAVVWELKILVILLMVTMAFLNFVWSHRVFGYCSVMMGAIPNDHDDPLALIRAEKAAKLNITAARAFNRGLRSVYFALGGLAWLVGAAPLIIATLMTLYVILRREYWSNTRSILLEPEE
ncbi:DUF599 domain-containing protein [Qingshengfaniella alkalisoli]|uniref:DUF599 domain-containing protein n=2 Tax=Qingshengfaniella alkalisoli TaxID=2599296 RepID=A0A5B8J7G9_9RHOB|nr:DUF599 domain-containing protein [Qingshengfaniella alkalisoli]